MKYLIALVIIFLPFIASAQLNSLLWEVSGNGLSDSSYLFGTMHSKDFRVHRFGDSVLTKLNKADLLVVENAEVEDYNLFDLFEQITMSETTIKELVEPEEHEFIRNSVFEKIGMAGLLYNRMKPMVLAMMIVELNSRQEMAYTVDEFLKEEANSAGKSVVGLETKEELFEMLDSESLENQAKMLLDFLQSYDSTMEESNHLINVYASEDLDELHHIYEKLNDNSVLSYGLLENRNKKCFNQVQNLIKQQSIFCAVGALHLPGETGLISMLRKEGYNVRPVYSDHTIKELTLKDYDEWYRYRNSETSLMMSFPDDPFIDSSVFKLSEVDSTMEYSYVLVDTLRNLTYSVKSAIVPKKYNNKIGYLSQQLRAGLVGEKIDDNQMNRNKIEVEYYIKPLVNLRSVISTEMNRLTVVSVEGSKKLIYSNLANKFLELNQNKLHQELKLMGSVQLMLDSSTLLSDSKTVEITIKKKGDPEFRSEEILSLDQFFYKLPLDGYFKMIFSSKGYMKKQIFIDTRNVKSEDIFEFPFMVKLFAGKGSAGLDKNYCIYYNEEMDDFTVKELIESESWE